MLFKSYYRNIHFIKIQTFKLILVAKDAFKQLSSCPMHNNTMNLTSMGCQEWRSGKIDVRN
jgi:hypothetical protein